MTYLYISFRLLKNKAYVNLQGSIYKGRQSDKSRND